MSALYYMVVIITFAFNVCTSLVPLSLAAVLDTMRVTVPSADPTQPAAIVDVMFNPLAPLNMYRIIGALLYSVQAVVMAAYASSLTFGGIRVDASLVIDYPASPPATAAIGAAIVLVCLLFFFPGGTGVWGACGFLFFATVFEYGVVAVPSNVDPTLRVVSIAGGDWALIVVPILLCLVLRSASVLRLPLMYAFALAASSSALFGAHDRVHKDYATLIAGCCLVPFFILYENVIFPVALAWVLERIPADERREYRQLRMLVAHAWGPSDAVVVVPGV